MKKHLKKAFCFLLATITLGCCIPIYNTAYAEKSSAEIDYAPIWQEVNGYYNIADDVNVGIYLGEHYTSFPTNVRINNGIAKENFSIGFIDQMNNNALFQEAYSLWKAASFVSDPVAGTLKALSKDTFYKTALIKMLDATFSSDNFIDWVNRGAIKNATKFCSILSKASKLDYQYDIANRIPISELTDAEKEHVINTVKGIIENDPNQYAAKCIGNVSKVFSVSKSIEEFAERAGTYYRLSQVADETVTVLRLLKNNTDDELLKNAVDSVVEIANDSFNGFFDAVANDAVISIGKSAIKSLFSGKWPAAIKKVLSLGELSTGAVLVDGALLAITVGQTVANISFNTNKKLEHYELLKAFSTAEQAMKSTVSELMSSFSHSDEEGFLLAAGIDLLYQTYDMDSELCLDLVNIMDKDWIQLSSQEDRDYVKSVINLERTYYNDQYKKVGLEQGACGDNLYWLFDSLSNDLIVYGYGKMYDYEKGTAPWYELRDSIKNLYISSYCLKIGNNSFCDFSNVGAVILTNKIYDSVTYGSGCFDNLNPDSHIVFPETATVNDLNVRCPVYALSDLTVGGEKSSINELYAQQKLFVSGEFAINKAGKLYADDFDSRDIFLVAKENSTIKFFSDTNINGRAYYDCFAETSDKADIPLDSTKLYNGASLTVYGNLSFCKGNFYAYAGSDIHVTGNFEVVGEVVCNNSYFYLYGSLTAEENIYATCGYLNDAILRIYGTASAKDIRQKYHPSSNVSAGIIGIYGKAFLTDDSVEHSFNNVFTSDKNAYVYVNGNVRSINNTEAHIYEGVNSNPCIGTIEITGNADFSETSDEKLTLIFSGENKQTVRISRWRSDHIGAGTIVINNKQGVEFCSPLKSYILFNHNQNPFSLSGDTNVFQDYDGDGIKDNEDPFPLDPLNGKNNSDFNVKLNDSKITITAYTGDKKNVVIPDSICGYNVIGIDGLGNNQIESLSLGANVTSVNVDELDKLTELKTISVAEDNKYLSSDSGILYNYGMTKLIRCPINYTDSTVSVPNSVSVIATHAFNNCNINNVVLSDNVSTIESYAFSDCANIAAFDLKSVKTIGSKAFYNSGLEEITIPEQMTSIGMQAFSNCSKLKTVYYNAVDCEIKTSVFIKNSPFPSSITTFKIGGKVKTLNNYLLKNSTVNEIYIPNSVEKIGNNTFYNCKDLTIKAYVNSYAKEFAQDNNFSFEPVTCGNCVFTDYEISAYPTCSADGEKTMICKICGTARTVKIEKTQQHVDGNSDGLCDDCGAEIPKIEKCKCICHRGGIIGFLYKIVKMLWKFFSINQVCACGATHY